MGKLKGLKKPGKKGIVCIVIILVVIAIGGASVFVDMQDNVEFTVLSEKEIPQDISGGVIPEYRSLERALACMVDEKVYVVVTRGEKPASGYKVDISKMKMENDDGKKTLIVYADFRDPDKESSMSQVLNYPLKVAKTDLKKLPDEIELRVRYVE